MFTANGIYTLVLLHFGSSITILPQKYNLIILVSGNYHCILVRELVITSIFADVLHH
jgi:hypothetical protein